MFRTSLNILNGSALNNGFEIIKHHKLSFYFIFIYILSIYYFIFYLFIIYLFIILFLFIYFYLFYFILFSFFFCFDFDKITTHVLSNSFTSRKRTYIILTPLNPTII